MRPAFAPLILEQVVHDAPFAWYLWSLAAVSPVLRAGDLAELDRRLDAYLDVAEIAGADARSPSPADRGALFVRAVLALRAGDREALERTLVDLQRSAQVDELADALVRVGLRGAAAIPTLLDNPAPLVRAAALHAARRCNLRLDERLGAHLADPHPQVLAAALRLVGDTRRRAFLPCLTPHLGHPDDAVRYQAARAGVLLGTPAAAQSLEDFLYGESPYLREALLLRYADASAADLSGLPDRIARSALTVEVRIAHLATFGLADTIPLLIDRLRDPSSAKRAGEAIAFIAGVDIAAENLDLDLGSDDPLVLDERLAADASSDLPVPDPDKLAHWWQAKAPAFSPAVRYLAGRPLEPEGLVVVQDTGTQTQAGAAGRYLALSSPDRPLTSVRDRLRAGIRRGRTFD